jgi:hypothetical protein
MHASGQLVPLEDKCLRICTLRSDSLSAISRETCSSAAADRMMNVLIHTAQVNEGQSRGVLSYPC